MAINTSKAVRQNIKARTGNPFSLTMVVENEDGTPADLSIYTPTLSVHDTGGKFIEFTLSDGIAVSDNVFTFAKPGAAMNFIGTFSYVLNPGPGMDDWLDGSFQIGNYNAEQIADNFNITLYEGLEITVQLSGGGGGTVISQETPESIKSKLEQNQGVVIFTSTMHQKLQDLTTATELVQIFQGYDNVISQLQNNIATLENEIQVLKGAPASMALNGDTIPDGTTGGYHVGDLTASGNPSPGFSVSGTDGALFGIQNGNQLWFNGTANRATKSSYTIVLIAANGIPPALQRSYTIPVTQVSGSAATYIELEEQTVRENAVVGTIVGKIISDGDPVPTYSLIDDADGHFDVDINGNLITLQEVSYTGEPYLISIRATNSGGTYDETNIPIYVAADTVDLTANWTALGTYNIGDTIPAFDFTQPFSIKIPAQFTSQSAGVVMRIGDANGGSGIWCEGGKLKARVGGSGTVNDAATCFLDSDLSVMTANNEYLLCFIPGDELRIATFVNGNKHRYHKDGSNTNVAPAATTGAYGITGVDLPPGMPDLNWDASKGTIGQATIYVNQIPSNA